MTETPTDEPRGTSDFATKLQKLAEEIVFLIVFLNLMARSSDLGCALDDLVLLLKHQAKNGSIDGWRRYYPPVGLPIADSDLDLVFSHWKDVRDAW